MPPINNPIVNNIIIFISKDERYKLFNMVDELIPGNYLEKAKVLEVKQSAYYQYKKKFLFCWDNVPGADNKKLTSLLKDNFGIGWAKKAKIDRFNDGKTIRLYLKRNESSLISLTLNDEKTKVTLKIGGEGSRTSEFVAKTESGKLNIYTKNLELSDSKTLLLLNLLHDKDPKEFNNILYPIAQRAKKQVSIIEDSLNSGLLELDFSLPGKLIDIYQRYEAKKNELAEKMHK